jgi:CheY-like chemotaxis protein
MSPFPPQILIIEGDPVLAEAIGELLRENGCRTVAVGTVREAVRRVSAGAVQAVILDLDTVPLGRDDQALIVLRTWFRICATPPPCLVIAVQIPASNSDREAPAVPVAASQSVEWIRKPFRKEDLLATVRRTIRLGLPRCLRDGRVAEGRPDEV